MKQVILIALIASTAVLSGCASRPYPTGLWFSKMQAPQSVTNNNVDCRKQGNSSMESYLGLISLGDASLEAAKADAGITKVGTVDYKLKSILGIYSETTTKVCGQ